MEAVTVYQIVQSCDDLRYGVNPTGYVFFKKEDAVSFIEAQNTLNNKIESLEYDLQDPDIADEKKVDIEREYETLESPLLDSHAIHSIIELTVR